MHKTDCIWTEPDRCNCGWLQEIAKNPRRVDDEIERLRAELAEARKLLRRCADTIDCLRDYVVEGGSIRMVGARQSVDDADTLLAAMAGGEDEND